MAGMKFRLNSGGMKALLNDSGVRADLTSRMERVAAAARASAPFETGAYRDGIAIWQDTTDRAAVRCGSRARHAPLVEAKTGNMARALDAAGGA